MDRSRPPAYSLGTVRVHSVGTYSRQEASIKAIVTAAIMAGALVTGAGDVHAMAWGGGRQSGASDATLASNSDRDIRPLPEPSTLYAVGAGLALLAVAGWYIRRRR